MREVKNDALKHKIACVYQDMKIFTLGIINCFKIINIKTQNRFFV